MTLREFILSEGCCGKKPCAAKDFDDEQEVAGGDFEFIVKVKVDGDSEADAKEKLKDALSEFSSVKIKGDKKEDKKAKAAKPEDDDESEDEAPIKDDGPMGDAPAAKKFKKKEDVCPQCGKLFSKCTCK